jgi:hypothetical protein
MCVAAEQRMPALISVVACLPFLDFFLKTHEKLLWRKFITPKFLCTTA